MRHYKASQRQYDKRWDWTSGNDPAGYCREWKDWGEEQKTRYPKDYASHVANRDKYHTHGHETAQEAADCYKQYLLDTCLQLLLEDSGSQRKCKVCGEWTPYYAMLPFQIWHLCPKHNTRQEIENLYSLSADAELWES